MPQINPISVNLADYDVIAIGTPTWLVYDGTCSAYIFDNK